MLGLGFGLDRQRPATRSASRTPEYPAVTRFSTVACGIARRRRRHTPPTGPAEALADLDRVLETISWQRPGPVHRPRPRPLVPTRQMRRIAASLADRAEVGVDDEGDLVVRVRRSPGGDGSPGPDDAAPSATRPWRTERYPGALTTIAAAVVDEPRLPLRGVSRGPPRRRRSHVERSPHWNGWPASRARMVAVDIAPEAVAVLERHQRASRIKGWIEPWWWRTSPTSLAGGGRRRRGTADVVMANPPWGEPARRARDQRASLPRFPPDAPIGWGARRRRRHPHARHPPLRARPRATRWRASWRDRSSSPAATARACSSSGAPDRPCRAWPTPQSRWLTRRSA